MDSPRSEKFETRFSTPVSDLDDHRDQPFTRPRGNTLNSPQGQQSPTEGRHVLPSANSGGQADSFQVNRELLQAGTLSRDFEHAVIDDDRSGKSEYIIERRGSHSPAVARRATVQRSQNPITTNRSRESSPSSRSTSPANSVDAFADPRRRERRNTVGSIAQSDLDLGLHRSVSGSTNRRSRRPTFDNGSVHKVNLQDDHASMHEAEDDICFPVLDEPTKTHQIDFEELDEFIAETSKTCPHILRQKLSFSSSSIGKSKILDDSRKPTIPKITTPSSSSLKAGSEIVQTDSASGIDDKDGVNEKETDSVGPKSSHTPEVSRYSFFSSELEQTIHAPDFADLFQPGETARDLFSTPDDGGGVWWLDILNPTESELLVFQRAFGIHRLTTEDIIMQEAREKVELFKKYYFVCFRSFHQMDPNHEDYMEPVNVYMVVFREGILTVTYTQSPHAAHVRKRIGKLRDYMALSADWICYAMIDDIVDTFGPPIHTIELEADTIEDNVFIIHAESFGPLLKQIGLCRKRVMSLMRLLGGKADVIKGFAKRCNESYTVTPRGEIGLYLGDIQDHVVTMMSNLSHFEKMLSRSHTNYLAQLSADNQLQGNKTNKVLSKITIIATILVPLNLVTGLFGMNVPIPGRETTGLGWFFGIIGCILFIVACCIICLRRMRHI
ncbi:magnesium transporter, partial [Lecanoromycetidae sp. Uapishka_2]